MPHFQLIKWHLHHDITYVHWDGCLHFPEYGLVVPTRLGTVDIHAMGSQRASSEPAVLHGVVQLAEAMMMNGRNRDRLALTVKNNYIVHTLFCAVETEPHTNFM